MDNSDEVKTFLTSRRAKVTPERAGLTLHTRSGRRVPGLRRNEVADLAGVSVEYYAKLERGNLAGVSESVLDALSRALQLDEAEHAHLLDLARSAGPVRRTPRRTSSPQVPASVLRILDGMTGVPAFVRNGRLDVLAINPLAAALYAPLIETTAPGWTPNMARFNFLTPQARQFWPNWPRAADETVALLRTEAGRDPYDRGLADLVGELSLRSEEFGTRWAAHDVRLHRTGIKHFNHPVVGALHLSFDAMALPTESGLTMTAFTAEPGSPDDDALTLLASWAASEPTVERPAGTSTP